MKELGLLPEIYIALLIIFACSIGVSIIFQKLKQPSIVGFLLTGIVVGPHALGLVQSQEQIEQLAQIGVAMLLFTIGMEFSIKDLLKSKAMIFIGGSGQVFLTIILGALLALAAGLPGNSAIFMGFIICLSSTAIGLSMLQKYGSMESPMGRLCLLILIFQDLMVVPLMLLTPVLGGEALHSDVSVWLLLGKGLLAIGLILVIARWVMPWAMNQIAASQSNELFIIGLVALCIAICSLTVWAGLSLALGAFIAGLMIAESPYNHQSMGYIIPLRDLFTSVFFVSIGMLLDLNFVAQHPFLVLAATLVIFAGKTIIAGAVSLFMGLPIGQSILAGIALAQVSEFSFVLANSGMQFHLLNENTYQLFLAAAVLTMIITPFMFSVARKYIANMHNNWSLLLNLQGKLGIVPMEAGAQEQGPSGHVIIVGFGPTGRMVARACKIANIPYIVVEMNSATVRNERLKGENIIYGDAANDSILEFISAKHARVLVVTATAPFLIRRVVSAGRAVNKSLYIITRTRFVLDVDGLRAIGANEVVAEEFETALDMFSRVLRQLAVPQNDIARLVHELKHENSALLKASRPENDRYYNLYEYLPNLQFGILRVELNSQADGKSLGELKMHSKLGLTVLAVKRAKEINSQIDSGTILKTDDVVVLYGPPTSLEQAQHEIFMLNLHVDEVEESKVTT